jgi:hypothetical protein
LEFYVATNDNNGAPLAWPQEVAEIGNGFGEAGCSEYLYETAQSGVEYSDDGDENRDGSDSHKPQWGWNDQYYFGWPGFMTWIAGKTNRDELLGLGNLTWINGAQQSSTILTNQLYTGSITTNSTPLTIPAFLAIASSQVEGSTVVCNGKVDAQGRIIQVYISSNSPGTNYWIYH